MDVDEIEAEIASLEEKIGLIFNVTTRRDLN